MPPEPELILASGSPRRRELLAELGLPFRVEVANVSEDRQPGEAPAHLAERLAREKAEAVADRLRAEGVSTPTYVIGADTVVFNGNWALGKPQNPRDAARMLRNLRGRSHRVVTGVAVVAVQTGRIEEGASTTRVWLRPMTDEEIAAYVATGDPLDKAGAYAIQNREFHPVEKILGCYSNVVGLPLCTLAELLEAFGIQPRWSPGRRGLECDCQTLVR
ncbi:MAG TPA: Maf family protein [Chloroflexota bacterium]|nr:Maf family protein [Chloroflexota bacterium]